MKIIKFFAFSMMFCTFGLKAIAQEVTKYNYGYAYSYQTKKFWVTNIVRAVDESAIYLPPSEGGLKNQWYDKLRTIAVQADFGNVNMSENSKTWIWKEDFSDVEEHRTKTIAKFNQEGFQIFYVKDMRYRQSKYND